MVFCCLLTQSPEDRNCQAPPHIDLPLETLILTRCKQLGDQNARERFRRVKYAASERIAVAKTDHVLIALVSYWYDV